MSDVIRVHITVLCFSPESFPSCVMEISPQEVEEYYSPKDFQIGQRVNLLGRTFLLCDCDSFTKDYYKTNHPDMELKPIINIPAKTKVSEKQKVRRSDVVLKYCCT